MCLRRHRKRSHPCPRANPTPPSSRRGWCLRRCKAQRPSARSPPSAITFMGACLSAAASTSRASLVDPGNAEVPVVRKCQLLRITRSSYCRPKRHRAPLKGDEHERAMRVIDEAHLEMPYADAHKIRAELRRRTGGSVVGRRLTFDPRFRVQTSGSL